MSLDTKHQQQIVDDGDCGLAALAMAAEVSYEKAKDYVPKVVYFHGLWITQVQYALTFITGKPWGVKYNAAPFYKQLSMYDFPKENCVYGVYRPEANWAFHYIMCDGIYIYDPLLPDKITLEEARLDYHSAWSIYAEIRA